MASGPASVSHEVPNNEENEIEKAVNSILEEMDSSQVEDNSKKRERSPTEENIGIPPPKKQTPAVRLYNQENKGPFEVIIKSKSQGRISPFAVGKIITTNHEGIELITRTGKNLSVICTDYRSANKLVQSQHLTEYFRFIPANRVQTVGVIYIEKDISEKEMQEESQCTKTIITAHRIKRRVDNELRDTSFMKLTFNSDTLPPYVTLYHVRMPIEPYIIPVKQCFSCFAYGHVAKSPCPNKPRCRSCGEESHEGECTKDKKCVHCTGPHSSQSKECPEYQRQKSIKTRMSLNNESYFAAVKFYPITYKQVKTYRRHQSYIEAVGAPYDIHSGEHFPSLTPTTTNNQFAQLDKIDLQEDQGATSQAYNTKPIMPKNKSNLNQTSPPLQVRLPKNISQRLTTAKEKFPPLNKNEAEQLRNMLHNKLKEIREKIKNPIIKTKEEIDNILSAYLTEGVAKTSERQIKSVVGYTNINKNGSGNKNTQSSTSNHPRSGTKPT